MGAEPGHALKYTYFSDLDASFAPLSKQVRQKTETIWSLPLPEFRIASKQDGPTMMGFPEPGKDITITHQMVPVRDGSEIEIRVYKRKAIETASLFLAAHGGGWTIGDHEVQEALNRLIAARSDTVVISVNYRLAPEFPYPTAINDCFDILQWCKLNASTLGINSEQIIVGGGSAGGNIAAVLAMKARDEGFTGIIGQVLNIPVTCHPKHFPADKYEYTSYQYHNDTPILDTAKMDWFWDQYLPGATSDVYASPLLAESLADLPPFLIQVAGLDPLRDEGLAYAEALRAAGVSGMLKIYPGLPHGFDKLTELEATARYNDCVVHWVSKITSRGGASEK